LERYSAIHSAPFQSRDEIHAQQLAALKRLISLAATHVPWYRQRFAEAALSADHLLSVADLSRFPVLTKDDIRNHAPLMTDERLDPHQLLAHHSGGSTGVPLTFYRDRGYLDDSDAGTWRNLGQAGWTPGDMVAFVWGWNDQLNTMSNLEFRLRQWVRRSYQFDAFEAGEDAFPKWAQVWNRMRPTVALGYASALARFAEWIIQSGQRIHQVRGSFTTAETLLPSQRAAIKRAFGGHVYNLYGSSEIQNIAAECTHGRMHVNSDYAVVESESGAESPSPLLLTSLRSRAMPFIRYRNEDLGRLDPGTCNCGNNFPLMALDIARISDNFVLPGGRVVHGEYFTHLMYGTQGIGTFQFHQTATGRILLRLVGRPGLIDSEQVRNIRARVESLAPGQLVCEVEQVPAIALSSAGKHRFTRSDVAPDRRGTP